MTAAKNEQKITNKVSLLTVKKETT